MEAPRFLAALFARQLDINSLVSAGVSIASSLAPAVTSALSIQVSVAPDSTGGTATAITSTATPQPTSTTAGPTSTPTVTTSVTSTTRGPTTSGPFSSISSSLSSASAAAQSKSHTSGGHSSRTGIIVGVVVGVIALILLALLIFCCLRRRKRGKKTVPFGKRWNSGSTASRHSAFGKNWPTDHAADVETAQTNHHPHTTVPIPAALVAGRHSHTRNNKPFEDPRRSHAVHSPSVPRTALGSVSEHPGGYTDLYTDGYRRGNMSSPSSRHGRHRSAGTGIARKPVPDSNSEPGRTHHGLLEYDTPPNRGIGLGSPAHGAVKNDGGEQYYSPRSWDEVDAVTRRPPSSQRYYQ